MLNIGQLGAAAQNEHVLQKLGWQMVNLPLETANAFANWYLAYASYAPTSVEGMQELLSLAPGRIKCVSEMTKGKGPIVVCGSGSSFNDVGPTLKNWPGPVMCSTSQASTLIKYGRVPTYITCLDPREAGQDELAAPDWGDAVIIGHVSIPHTYIAKWLRRAKGAIYLGRIMEPTYDWYSHHLGRGYPWIRHIILPMIDSVAANIGFAAWLGYNPIYLTGVDYGGPRFDRYDWNYDKQEWTFDDATSRYDAEKNKEDFSGMSAKGVMGYSSRGSLISAYMQMRNPKYQERIYQLSGKTTVNQFPWVSWPDGETDPVYPLERICDDIEITLALWDTFIVPLDGGWGKDYHTYIADSESNFFKALESYNNQVKGNLVDFARIENDQKRPIRELIAQGIITIEAGDLLLHGAEEFGEWDWHKIREIDIPVVLMRRRWLLEEGKRRGYTKTDVIKLREAIPGDALEPAIQASVELNRSGDVNAAHDIFAAADTAEKKEATGGTAQ